MTFLRIVIPLYILFEHDLRANASRLSRGKTGSHPSGRGPRACFSGSCPRSRTHEQVAPTMQAPRRTKRLWQAYGPKFSGRSRHVADRRSTVNILLTNAA